MITKTFTTGNLSDDIVNALDSLGGISAFVKSGETVFIKPNFNTADPPPASSDIEFIAALIGLLYQNGAKKVIVGESSTSYLSAERVIKQKGARKLEKDGKTEVMNLDRYKRIKKLVPNGKYLKAASIPAILDHVDRLILLPCLKTHSLAQFTGSLKLSIGFLKKSEKIGMHMGNLQEKVAELNLLTKPDLIIMDGRKCFISGGPAHGELRSPGVLLASANRVELDIEAVKIIQSFPDNSLAGISPSEIPQIKHAIKLGIY